MSERIKITTSPALLARLEHDAARTAASVSSVAAGILAGHYGIEPPDLRRGFANQGSEAAKAARAKVVRPGRKTKKTTKKKARGK